MHLFPAQLLSQNRLPCRICGVGYENALGNVQPDCRNLTHGWPLRYGRIITGLWHRLMSGAEAIHPIKLNDVDPYAYLADTLTRIVGGHLASAIDALLPWAYARAQPLQDAA